MRSQTEDSLDSRDASSVDAHPGFGRVLGRAVLGVLVLTAMLSALAAAGSFIFGESAVAQADIDSVQWLAERRTALLDAIATQGSALSDTWTIIGMVAGSASMLWVSDHRRFAVMIVLTIAIELATFLAVGALVDRTRPEVDSLHSTPTTPSYPSGHTAAAFALYGAFVVTAQSISSRRPTRLLWILPAAVAVVVGLSRVYEAVHHPSDVVAGFLLGVGALTAAVLATGVGNDQRQRK